MYLKATFGENYLVIYVSKLSLKKFFIKENGLHWLII